MRSFLVSSVLSAAAAGVGSLGVKTDSRWYAKLDKPSWQPPPAVFPVAWTPLYSLIAWGTGRGLDKARDTGDDKRLLALTVGNLALNAGWNWAFFTRQSPAGGLAVILALDVLNVALVSETAKHDKVGAAALVPYAAWTGFATALNAELWRRNR
ncbi:TspO/MBR family protein [Nocardioides houyundeii]|uniref:TspO/MBR family protein n=1 Tax=Nocardioides houyundeii TaxID=2045452 RepID=UPI000C78E9CA|nr:TspO/MBR family protein [Nocardioides houyundeii]